MPPHRCVEVSRPLAVAGWKLTIVITPVTFWAA
jgi:hypothetical protein